MPRHATVKLNVLNQGLKTLVVLLLADEAQNQQPHVGIVKVGREGVQDMDLCAPHSVLVKGVVANRHDHGEGGEGARLGVLLLGVAVGQGQGRVAEVDARGDGGYPRREGRVDGEVGGGNAELRAVVLVCELRQGPVEVFSRCRRGLGWAGLRGRRTSFEPLPKPEITFPSIT